MSKFKMSAGLFLLRAVRENLFRAFLLRSSGPRPSCIWHAPALKPLWGAMGVGTPQRRPSVLVTSQAKS